MAVKASATISIFNVDDGTTGETGVGVDKLTAYYAVGASGTTKPSAPSTTEWSTTLPTVSETQYLWLAYLVTYTDGTTAWTEPYCVTDVTTRERVTALETDLTVVQGQISSKVWQTDIDTAAENVAEDLHLQITEAVQTSQEVIFSALDQYSKTSDLETLKETLSAQLAIMANQISIDVSKVTEQYEAADGLLKAQIEEITAHYRFTDDGQYIGLDGSDAVMRLFNDVMQIIVSGVVATQVDRDGLTADRANIQMLNMGPYTWQYNNTDGHLSLT